MTPRLAIIVATALVATACHSESAPASCDPAAQTGCGSGQYCEPVQAGSPACFAPVVVRGTVSDLTAGTLLNDALVVALDTNRAPLSTVGTTTNGAYELKVRAARDATGKPVQASITLRADKQGYQAFPGGLRTALPIDLSGATLDVGAWTVSGALTTLSLAPVAGGGSAFIHGNVAAVKAGAGLLIVAEPVSGGAGTTGVADDHGNYAIFNLVPGTQYVVTAYAKGANYLPATTAGLAAGDNLVPTLAAAAGTGSALTGGLIFNNGASSNIQVTLVVQSTYVSGLDRGESPPGLTVQGGDTGYSFDGVPDGKYVVLAAFGLDGDVRDLSGTGNTAAPQITIQNGAVVGTPPSFKIIPAVDLMTIGGTNVSATPAVVATATPTFTWQKTSVDSSAATYRVLVVDSFGNVIWSHDMAATMTDSITYAGPPLQADVPYQLRILAIKESSPGATGFTQLSQTEDVAGVFVYRP